MHFSEESREEPAGPAELGAGRVPGLCVCLCRGAVPALPARLPGHSGERSRPRAEPASGSRFSQALSSVLQLMPTLSLPHVSGSPRQSLGRLVVGRGILHVRAPDPSRSGARLPPCSVPGFGRGAPSSRPAASLDRPREQLGGAGPAWAGPSVPTGTEASA